MLTPQNIPLSMLGKNDYFEKRMNYRQKYRRKKKMDLYIFDVTPINITNAHFHENVTSRSRRINTFLPTTPLDCHQNETHLTVS